MRQPDLSDNERRVMIALFTASQTGERVLTTDQIATDTGLAADVVERTLADLERGGYVMGE